MNARSVVILNPGSARGAAGRRFERLAPRLRAHGVEAELRTTRAPGEAGRIAREAVRAGARRLIVAGGDGTANEVVDGLLAAGLGHAAELGFVPLGTGCDFARTLGVPRDPAAALAALEHARVRRIDAGRVRCAGAGGGAVLRHFVNAASLGVSPLAVAQTARMPRALGGRSAFALGTASALLRHRSARVELQVDGKLLCDEPLVLAAICGGRHFGGGMRVAPEAALDDGVFDVVAVRALGALRLIAKLPKLYRGTHLADPIVRHTRGARIEARAPGARVLLEADGESLGELPAEIELLPGALRVLAPAAEARP